MADGFSSTKQAVKYRVPASSYWNIIDWISFPFLLLSFLSCLLTQACRLIPWMQKSWAAAFPQAAAWAWEAGWCQLGLSAQMCRGENCLSDSYLLQYPGLWEGILSLPSQHFSSSCPSPVLGAPCPVLISWIYCCHSLLLPHLPSPLLSAVSRSFPVPHNHFLILNLILSNDFIYNDERSKNKLRRDEYKNEKSTTYSWLGFRCVTGNTGKLVGYIVFSYNLVPIVLRWISGKTTGSFYPLKTCNEAKIFKEAWK